MNKEKNTIWVCEALMNSSHGPDWYPYPDGAACEEKYKTIKKAMNYFALNKVRWATKKVATGITTYKIVHSHKIRFRKYARTEVK
jgi:hypothetical protein